MAGSDDEPAPRRFSWNPWRGLEGLPRGMWVLAAASLVNRAGTMVVPFLILYLTTALGFSPARAGLALFVYGVASLVASPLAGRLCDRWGAERVMLGSLFSSGVMLLLFPLARSWTAVVVASVLLSATNEAFRPANLALVSHIAAGERLRASYALIRLAINLGMSIGPAVGGFLATVDFRLLFWVDGATSLLAGVLLLWLGVGETRPAPAAEKEPGAGGGAAAPVFSMPGLRNGPVLVFLLGVVLTAVVFFQHEGPMPLYLVRDLGLATSAFGLLFTVNTILIVFLELPLNLAMARLPHGPVMAVGALFCAAGFGSLAFATGFGSAVATVVVWTVGEMILFPTMSAWMAEAAPADRRGEYMGLYTMAFAVAFAVGPWLGTVAYERFGGNVLWGGTFLVGVLSAALLCLVRAPRREEPAGAPA